VTGLSKTMFDVYSGDSKEITERAYHKLHDQYSVAATSKVMAGRLSIIN